MERRSTEMICEHCCATAPTPAPYGWCEVSFEGGAAAAPHCLCSMHCLVAWAADHLRLERARELAASWQAGYASAERAEAVDDADAGSAFSIRDAV